MDIKKITKRNLKFVGKEAVELAAKAVLYPFGLGFLHASYIYYYATHTYDSDWSRNRFMREQVDGFEKLMDTALDKLYDSIDHDEKTGEWRLRLDRLRRVMNERADTTLPSETFSDMRMLHEVRDNIDKNGCVQYSDRARIRKLEEKFGLR